MGNYFGIKSGNNSFALYASVLKKDLQKALGLFAEVLQEACFKEEEIAKEKNIIFSEIEQQDSDIFVSSFKKLKLNMYQDHPYKFSVLGTKQTLESLKSLSPRFYPSFVLSLRTCGITPSRQNQASETIICTSEIVNVRRICDHVVNLPPQ